MNNIDPKVGLTFNQLRSANSERLLSSSYVKCEDSWTHAHWMQALIGEIGELANFLKKVDRGDFTLESALPDIERELADTQCYLDILAHKLGVDLGAATVAKFNEVSERIGSHVRLTVGDCKLYAAGFGVGVSALTIDECEELKLLREYRNACINFNYSHGVEADTLEEAVEIERKAEDRLEKAQDACNAFYSK